ncbi:glycosyltransferase family 4 protein [Spirosoma pollinicola]|uniref:Glycosyltransferase family 1 protein n=1 Tax=Spirosoma pollinicola TaxID=2057025 RepID=A0A2K8Z5C8_9BACT|nr:glycosyltransferase family 1 protein [Spirosoma pollinicola]AUD05060.1 glycosyltransferase family 1 protein [Spirosoma pollinicola]
MKIFFDHQAFSLQNYGGISRYFCELINGINSSDINNAHLSLLWSNNAHVKEYGLSGLTYPLPGKHRLLSTSNKLFNIVDARLNNYDIYHATYFDDFLGNLNTKKPLVTTFYDMTYERLAHKFSDLSQDKSISENKRKIAKSSAHLIAISESTKNDMVELLGVAPEKISVIYLGSSFVNEANTSEKESFKSDKPYLLYVGNRNGYKNFETFIRASSGILIKYDVKLICAGGGVFSLEEQDLFKSLFVSDLVEYSPVNDKILPKLYKSAISFVFPSLYEGFGIPVLEAFSCDCPCVVSNTSSLPEVAGEAAFYIDPLSEDSIAHGIERVITEPSLRAELVKKGKDRLKQFSWDNTVRQTVELYQKLV